MKCSMFAIGFLYAASLSPAAIAQHKVGDSVVVIRDTCTRIGTGRCNSLGRGRSLTVEHVKDDWLWLGPGSAGWVKTDDVATPERAFAIFGQEIERDPRAAGAYYARAVLWHGKYDFDRAIADYTEVIKLRPRDRLAVTNRGTCYQARGDIDRALADYNEAIRLCPDVSTGYTNRAAVWIKKGEPAKAVADCDAALQINPHASWSYVWRADAFEAAGDYARAKQDFERALALDDATWWTLREFARFLATCPDAQYRDGRRAVRFATSACEKSKAWPKRRNADDADMTAVLAAAYAESGDFANAVEWQSKAAEMADESLRGDYQARCDLYRSGLPYRGAPRQ